MPATATKERPILFSGPMVRAILEGRKVQTRRIVKPQPPNYINDLHGGELSSRAPYTLEDDETGCVGFWDDNDVAYKCPYGQPGERLWIKAGYRTQYNPERNQTNWIVDGCGFAQTHGRALSKSGKQKRDGNHPGMFMPYWLSCELLPPLEITDVRVERLQEISEGDAVEEGMERTGGGRYWLSETRNDAGNRKVRNTAVECFRDLWNSINGPGSWDQNPWVWVVGFERITN